VKATIIADSLHSESGIRLTTVLVEGFPKGFGLQDITRHRAGAFSVESSRAITAKNYREREMYVPKFLANKPGMVPGGEVEFQLDCEMAWDEFIQQAIGVSMFLERYGVHKDLCNAPLDFCAPISWVMTLDHHGWQNLLTQRCAHDARPQVRELCRMIYDQWIAASPVIVQPGGLHLPFITDEERNAGHSNWELMHASAARCGRVSTNNHLKQRPIPVDVAQGEDMADKCHWSPLEHPCRALSMDEIKDIWNDAFDCRDKCEFGPFDPSWQQLRKKYAGEHGSVRGPWDPSWRLPYEVK